MKLDRNINNDGRGKYLLVNLRNLAHRDTTKVMAALEVLKEAGILETDAAGDPNEFFVMKLKDINAPGGLAGYADKAEETDPEWAEEVRSLLQRAGEKSPYCKLPD